MQQEKKFDLLKKQYLKRLFQSVVNNKNIIYSYDVIVSKDEVKIIYKRCRQIVICSSDYLYFTEVQLWDPN